jgi:predicted lipoprotein with Yx(FWY)xxD motif
MNRKYLVSGGLATVIAVIALIVAVSGGSAQTRQQQTAAAGSAVSVRSTSLGKTLVDAQGRTLYLFEGDRPNVSKLSAAGLSVWPRFIAAGNVKATGGTLAGRIGTITSPSGIRQVTYNSHPLYYYAPDTKPGSTLGQRLNEFGGLWYVLGPGGSAVTSAPTKAAAAPATPAPSQGYGY